MKYSRDDLNHLMYKDYVLLMAEELNINGFSDSKEWHIKWKRMLWAALYQTFQEVLRY